jgi:hypothetical protein
MHPDLPIWFLYGSNSWIKDTDAQRAMSFRPETSKTYIKVRFFKLFFLIFNLFNGKIY